MQKTKYFIIISLFVVITIFGLIHIFLLNDDNNNLNDKYTSLIKENKSLKKDKEDLSFKLSEINSINDILNKKYNLKDNKIEIINNTDIESLQKENKELKTEIQSLQDKFKNIINNKEIILVGFLKMTNMNIGSWELNDFEKERILKMLSNEKSFYEIIPIVDNKNYMNDPDELKQLGLSRKRASLAVTLLRSLNPTNKIFLSTEVIISDKNERGFIINQYK